MKRRRVYLHPEDRTDDCNHKKTTPEGGYFVAVKGLMRPFLESSSRCECQSNPEAV